MAPNHPIPTAPRKNPVGPAAKLPRTPPTARSSSGQNSPDNFALLQRSVKRDAHQVILAVLQLPLFAQAVIGFCRVAAGIPGTQADHAQYLGTMQLRFADQADFPRIAKQKGLFDSLTATLPVIDRDAANDSTDIQSFLTFADAILQIEKNCREVQRQREAEELKRRTQGQDVDMLANLKPGSEAVLLLLGQVDAALETVQLANDDALLPCADLQKHREAVQLAAQQQLYSLDIALQVYKLISVRLARLDKTLGPSDVERTGDLLNDLQVLPEIIDSDSDIEITPSSPKNPCPPVLVQEATAL
ncbi:hypothetical protein C0989_008580 [Termitomyces sp. Mn162]|nr:hypothetical protein C0989_008580 [Termitomyces sp. Mn162]